MACTGMNWIVFLLFSILKSSYQDIIDDRGKEFIVSFIHQPPHIAGSNSTNVLYICSFEKATVRIQVPFLGYASDGRVYDVLPANFKEISLPSNMRMPGHSNINRKGIRITASKPITVYGLQKGERGGTEAFLGLSVDVLGSYYIVPTFFPTFNAIVQVTANEDNTQVSIKLKIADGGAVDYSSSTYYSGDFINVTLNDLEVFQVLGDSDLTGTIVTSTKPVAVFSGDDCAMIPDTERQCNQLVEQIPPVELWGQHFITSPTPNNQGNGDVFHILSSMNGTLVTVNGTREILQKGFKYEVEARWNQSLEIITSEPCLVVQYSSRTVHFGRPAMNIVPPRKWSSNDILVYVEEGDSRLGVPDYDGYVNVVIETRLRSGLRVKGPHKVPINWVTLSNSFSQASLHLRRSGSYHVFHESPLVNFTSVMYGMNSKITFSFPAGFRWELGLKARCVATRTQGGDKIDNDCDGITDEELENDVDDDADGKVDEDLATPRLDFVMPQDIISPPLFSCSLSIDPRKPGFYPTKGANSSQGICEARGNVSIFPKDSTRKRQDCQHQLDRVWTVEDACQNKIEKTQQINVITPRYPVLTFPSDMTLFCRDKKYLGPQFTGLVLQESGVCKRTVNITSKDTYRGDCSSGEAKLERLWLVKDACRETIVKTQVITLVPKGSKRTTNYKMSFRITSEKFSSELIDTTSSIFRNLSTELEDEMESTFRRSKLGKFFVEAKVLSFSNGSVTVDMLLKMDMQAKVEQQNILVVMMDSGLSPGPVEEGEQPGPPSEGPLGKFQVDLASISVQDFDECQSLDLNKCHQKATCTNTPGSYNCTCVDGYVGDGFLCRELPFIHYSDPPISSGAGENVTLNCHARGFPELMFSWITPDGQVVNGSKSLREIESLDDGSINIRGKILQKDGSLLVFDTRVSDSGIYKCVVTSGLGEDERNVNLTVNKDIVEVDVAITLEDEVFDRELENKSSARYQDMEEKVEKELTELFKDVEGFQRIEILGFVNGSVKVRFRVIVKVDKTEEKEPTVIAKKVGKILKVSVKDGKIGNLKVKPVVEFREVPPPPVDVASSDVTQTEAAITWSHPELHDMYGISGYSLQFKKFGTSKWSEFVFTEGEDHRITSLEQDTAYMVRLKSQNEFGRGVPSDDLELMTKKESSASKLALAIVLPILFLVILAMAAFFMYRKWKKRKQRLDATDEKMPMHPVTPGQQSQPLAANERLVTFGHDRYAPIPGAAPNGGSASVAAASFSWREIPRHRLTLGKVLGEGEFGMVVKGELTEEDGNVTTCAVKKLKRAATESDFKDLLNELEIMSSVGNHPNLVNLIGACSVDGPLMILVEFAEHGSLLRYLRDRRKQNYENMNEYTLEISSSVRLKIAWDVSEGMKHLATKKCAHRDLAARNVLLGEGLVAKVSDFGLSRDIYTDDVYEKKTGGKLPAKWMAVESLEQGIYTSQSDVWSFGVLLWEIETGGCAPYAGMVVSDLLDKIKGGSRLERPRYCTESLYDVMLQCWNANPRTRPTFQDLSEDLHRLYKQTSEYMVAEDFRIEPDYVNSSVENTSTA